VETPRRPVATLHWPKMAHHSHAQSGGSRGPGRRTKIVCTLGPASLNPATLTAMLRAGMDVARLNTSHGTVQDHLDAIDLVRATSASVGKPIAILMDLGGPKLRTGPVPNGVPLQLHAGDTVRLETPPTPPREGLIIVDYPHLATDVRADDRVLLDDGAVELLVEHTDAGGLECRVIHGGTLSAGRGVSFPDSLLTLPALTDRDRAAVSAGVRAGVDLFALSFVRAFEDVVEARALLAENGSDTPIIAKIERRQALSGLDDILAEADGAMVARGDLGVELPPEEVPLQQRRIIASAATHMVPVIIATQMLESMVESPRPTRAESSDVANGVWAYADALMLSQETAVGHYPVEAVAMMDRIIRRAESVLPPDMPRELDENADDHSLVVALAARRIVESDPNMRAIVCFTRSGYTAFLLSKVHPQANILAVTPSEAVGRRLNLARGVVPVLASEVNSTEEMLRSVDRLLMEGHHCNGGDEVVVVGSMPVGQGTTTNFLKLHRVGETADR